MLSPIRVATLILLALPVTSARALELVTYNILNYSSGRTAQFQTVMGELDADVLVVQEILSQSAVNGFLANVLEVLEPGEWAAGPFVNGPDTDNAIFYKPDLVTMVGHHVISTALRDIDEWTVRPVGYDDDTTDLRIYAVHLKASQGSESLRLAEVQAMRVRMETFLGDNHYIVLGDFNVYTSAEPAYQYMLSTSGGFNGVVEDPIDTPGSWHNSSSFAAIHTQSPRTTQFGGGANGGMDDRFDIILTSPAMDPATGAGITVLPDTYEAFGNDGQHFNDALTDPPAHPTLPATVIEALHDGSDHLPVRVELSLPSIMVVNTDPLEFGGWVVGSMPERLVAVSNPAVPPADALDHVLTPPAGFSAPDGTQSLAAGGSIDHPILMDAASSGSRSGTLFVTGDAPDNPAVGIPLTGYVLDQPRPSTEPEDEVTETTLAFGTHTPGDFEDVDAEAHNVGYQFFQALLEITGAEFTGDERFSLAEPFDPVAVAADPALFAVTFDDAGATDGLYQGTLILHTADQADLGGASPRADLVYQLVAEVQDGVLAADAPVSPARTALLGASPNPFRPHTTLTFGMAHGGPVRITVFDVSGRSVARLIDSMHPAGIHRVSWDGRDRTGREVGAGIYYVRFEAGPVRQTDTLVRTP
jgi:endonuclease/exonuclease/phosphatase family metal-dependent hydrolase